LYRTRNDIELGQINSPSGIFYVTSDDMNSRQPKCRVQLFNDVTIEPIKTASSDILIDEFVQK